MLRLSACCPKPTVLLTPTVTTRPDAEAPFNPAPYIKHLTTAGCATYVVYPNPWAEHSVILVARNYKD